MHLLPPDLASLPERYRTNFVNSITGFKSLALIGTADAEGQTNLAIFSSVVHLGSNPPLVGIINRPATDTARRHTLENILATGFYTLNHVTPSIYTAAHQTSARYPADVSEFDATGLTPFYSTGVAGLAAARVPYVAQSSVRLGMQYVERHDISNGTVLIVGRIVEVFLPPDTDPAAPLVSPDGYINLEAAATLCGSGVDSYHTTQRVERLAYAKTTEGSAKRLG